MKVAQIKKSLQICYSNFQIWNNKSVRIFYLSNLYLVKLVSQPSNGAEIVKKNPI